MYIEKLDLLAFGSFTDHEINLSAGPHQFHVVYGPNESGKSTCLRAITALLFGFPTVTTDNYLHNNAKLRIGATLHTGEDKRLQFIRRKGRQNTILGADGKTALKDEELTLALGGIDEATFHHRFALSHEQLIEGGKAILESQGELGEILFAAGAGVGKLRAILSQLENEERELFAARARKTVLNAAISDLESKRGEIKELQRPPAQYRTLCEQIEQAERKSVEVNVQISDIRLQLLRYKAFSSACKVVPLWRHAQKRLDELGSVPALDEDFTARRREANANCVSHRKRSEELQSELQLAKDKQVQLTPDAAILDNAESVVALFLDVASRQAAETERTGLKRVLADHDRQLRRSLTDLDIEIAEDAGIAELEEAIKQLQISDAAHTRISELAANAEVLRQLEQDAGEHVRTLKRELDELDEELEQTPTTSDPKTLETVLGEIGPPREILAAQDQRKTDLESGRSECQQIAVALGLGKQTFEDIKTFTPPSPQQIDDCDETFGQCHRRIDQLKDQRSSLLKRRQTLEAELTQLQTEHALPTEQELAQSRELRDQMVDRWIAAKTDEERLESAQKTRNEIRKSDQMVDTLRHQQEKVVKADSIRNEIAQLSDEAAKLSDDLEGIIDELQEVTIRWEALWQDRGVAPGTVSEMRQWVNRHQGLVEKLTSLSQAESLFAQNEEKIRRMSTRLSNALALAWSQRQTIEQASENSIDIDAMEFESLHDAAIGLKGELQSAWIRRNQLQTKRDELAAAIPAAQSKFESCRTNRQQWEEQWQQATANIVRESSATPSVVNAKIKKITELFQQKRERDNTAERIEALSREQKEFDQRVITIANLVEHEADDAMSSGQTAKSLYERLQAAREADAELKRTVDRIKEIETKLAQANEALQEASTILKQLCDEAGVASVDDLPDVEQKAAAKRSAQQDFDQSNRELISMAGSNNPEEFAIEVESFDPIEITDTMEKLSAQVEELSKLRTEVDQNIGALKNDRDRIDGSDRAAILNQDLQMALGRISHHAEQWARLRVASMIMRQSIDHYRRANESPVLKIACDAFSQLTLGKYKGLRPEYDDKDRWALVGVQQSENGIEQTVPVELMSDGTRDSVFLAMRLASIEHQLSSGRKFPVIVDDCLIQLDDERAAAGLKLFSNLSAKTQVLMFTHHEHVLDLATETLAEEQFHVHRLPT
ncbi:AAA family ATPase [Stieleria sp. JC731]|uniref:YhaN family protein n=1 Tax=Pirellulaceae TaxID=2691357 RepID=UPI001E4ABDEE|nr:YhaN family protein [Stieleria sp. JC731]MCC9601052.1 AAA family ATPase [Stieleria sp. JC731]